MPDVSTNEPLKVRAGDTWSWRRDDLSDYPAPTWALYYRLKNAAANISIAAAANGTGHLVTVAAATTLTYTAGTYQWVAYVEFGTERHSVDEGTLLVLPAFANSNPLDARSTARKILADLMAAYESYASNRGLVKQYTIGNRSMTFNAPEEILTQINYWRAEVAREDMAERARNGIGTGNKLFVRSGG